MLDREHEDAIGHYNELPPNLEQIEEWQFWSWFLTYVPIRGGRTLRQCMRDRDGNKLDRMRQFTLLISAIGPAGPEGYAIEHDHGVRRGPAAFYTFTCCVHEWKTTANTIRGWHERECVECGMHESWDSSG